MQRLQTIFPKENIYRIIIILTVWQFLSVGLMAVGTWPTSVAVANTILLGIFILLSKPYYSVLLLVLSIPFYVILPNPIIANLPMWRILFALLFVVWLLQLLVAQRQRLLQAFAIKRWHSSTIPISGAKFREVVANAYERITSRLMAWDKVAALFLLIAVFSLLIAKFPAHGLKQIIFILNVYVFYLVIISVVTDQQKIKELIRYTTYSLGIMVALGFVQFIGTLFSSSYYFWQYWATMVSSLYYGQPLANVLIYSNSWFSYSGGSQALRMFGILPDTHAFGVMTIFLLAYLVPRISSQQNNLLKTIKSQSRFLLIVILLTCLAVMINGTRGVWVAMLAPIGLAALAYWQKILQPYMKITLAVYSVIILLFVLSPFISQALNFVRTYDAKDDFLGRASSIYDLSESSNAGRIEIWKESVKYAGLHPFGVGYGNFIVSIVQDIPQGASFEQVSSVKNLRFNLPQAFITAHSLYLQLLVELGFAGLLAFILFWWEYLEKLWVFVREHGKNLNQYVGLVVSLFFAFAWILAYGVFDVTILNDRVLQYLFISLAISGLIFTKYKSFQPKDNE